ncbi:MAG TPA: hypothetical protein PLP33_27170 [Leptospiraceae bacterium]|nr:hypothetical protein [Leptospiraceae bacterium]
MGFNTEQAKNFLLSKTVWGVIVMAVAIFSDSLGVKLGESVDAIIGFIGAALALYGRVKASGPLSVFSGFFEKK